MAQQKTGADLFAELDALGSEEGAGGSSSTPQPPVVQAAPAASTGQGEDDVSFALDDIQKQLAAKQQTSRPITPRLSSSTTSGTTNNRSPKRVVDTPASSGQNSTRNSEERGRSNPAVGLGVGTGGASGRSSGEMRSYHQASVPEEAVQDQQEQTTSSASGGGWGWGSFFSTAAAAVSQAQTIAKELRSNEEVQRYTSQVKGYGANLQSLRADIQSRALPTFTSLITHIAPPISAHERLCIHATHDILHYPSLDPLIYTTFSRVMAQVEGGDLMVIQRGSENRSRSASSEGYRGNLLSNATGGHGGWTDGPWWRDDMSRRDLGVVAGLKEGTRLARVSAESYAKEYFDARGGVEEAARIAAEGLSESNPVRRSDIFLAIQAVSYPSSRDLFAGDAREAADKEKETTAAGVVVDPTGAEEGEDQVAFAIYLHDPIHSLSFSTLSQSFPQKWATWLDAPAGPASTTSATVGNGAALPDSIVEIIAAGGVDPREWIAEWMEETLSLSVGVVAQNYVARRMGVGDGGLGRGKRRVEDEGVGGEAARAL